MEHATSQKGPYLSPMESSSTQSGKPFFSGSRERRYWVMVLLVVGGIMASLFLGQPLLKLFKSQDVQAGLFLTGMALTTLAIFGYGFRRKAGKSEWFLLIGILAVYLMCFLRLGLAERSHLIEYSVLALLIHQALSERKRAERLPGNVSLYALLLTFAISLLDECLQLFIPFRVFDPEDILFNALAILGAIGAVVLLRYVRKLKRK